MCGIAGIVSPHPARWGQTIKAMTDAIRHRGPDGQGVVALDPGRLHDAPAEIDMVNGPARVFLGHRRLSIIDIEGSHQPLRNEDGSVWVVFNGEIYNYRELADNLCQKNHLLREKGDTETLVHLWESYREDMLTQLNGMFAFALYDTRTDTLFLARDRYGEKPLFYWDSPGCFAFASELQALWEVEGFPIDAVDDLALAQYFRYGYVPSPLTIYPGVRRLPPGCCLIHAAGRTRLVSYWTPSVTGGIHSLDPVELRERFDGAVKSRLVADVPLGCFLSGGLDSSLVAASMSRQTNDALRTFTISTGDPVGDESAEARRIAEWLGSQHSEFRVEPDFVSVSEKLARHFGQPFADYSSVPTYYVSQETRKSVKVALSGDGGDELFAGYERYANMRMSALCGVLPRPLRAFVAGIAERILPASDLRSHLADFARSAAGNPQKGENHSTLFYDYWGRACFTADFQRAVARLDQEELARFSAYYHSAASSNPLDRWLETDQRMYLTDDILAKVDTASMAVSLETRAPFLDHGFAEYVNRLDYRLKIANGKTKRPLRGMAAQCLPAGIADLPKRGFTLPLAGWLRADLKSWTESLLFENKRLWSAYLREAVIENMWQAHQQGRADHSMRLWVIAAFCLWRRSTVKSTR
jgi:asparagine synthase (glutamine-hydrolysing)